MRAICHSHGLYRPIWIVVYDVDRDLPFALIWFRFSRVFPTVINYERFAAFYLNETVMARPLASGVAFQNSAAGAVKANGQQVSRGHEPAFP